MQGRGAGAAWGFILLLLVSLALPAQGRPRAKRRASDDLHEGLVVLACVAAVVLLVPVLLTAWRMYNDPLTPHLWAMTKQAIQQYFTSPAKRRAQQAAVTSRERVFRGYSRPSHDMPAGLRARTSLRTGEAS